MTRVPSLSFLSRAARRFGRDEGGNMAVLFGIAVIPILTFVGAAADYSRPMPRAHRCSRRLLNQRRQYADRRL